MPELRFSFITLDCVDIDRIARFWADVLEGSIGEPMDDGRYVFIRDRDDLPTFCLQRVSEPTPIRRR